MANQLGSASDERCQYCTFSLTQTKPVFQSIFVCHSCTPEDGQMLCLCQACADHCHADHDGLEYVGMGPCYCDCRQILVGCRIETESDREARRLLKDRPYLNQTSVERPLTSVSDSRLYSLFEEKELAQRLQVQTHELVKHSKETFWLDSSVDPMTLCELELLAWTILKSHCQRYSLEGCGGEWWVQVKKVSSQGMNGELNSIDNTSEAVDLHYDKDEIIAEKFGIGVFPLLSTVTYLTDLVNAPPTVLFSKRYDQPEDEPISEMLLSYPRQGNHLIFDGRLLHGAPANYLLRRSDNRDNKTDTGIRITFLVNIWDLESKPVGIEPLPHSIRQCIINTVLEAPFPLDSGMFAKKNGLTAQKIMLKDEESMPEAIRRRIELPFLGATTTWESASDDGSTTFVLTYPPPLVTESDLLLVSFGPGMEAYVENDSSGDEDELIPNF